MFFVSGITGQVGGAAARHLLAHGQAVRALVRDPGKAGAWLERGVELRRGDFNDAEATGAALDGVEGAFVMLPPFVAPAPGFPEAQAMIGSFREALRRAPPPRLVALSSIGSQRDSGLGMITATHLLEKGLGNLRCPTAFVRAGSLLENYTRGLDAAAATGWFDSYLMPTDRPVPMLATEDVGRLVAGLLTTDWTGTRILEQGSPVSPDELAQAMGEVLGRSVQARAVPREQWNASLAALGMPSAGIAAFTEMEDGFNSGWIAFGVAGTEPVAAAITPAQVFGQYVIAQARRT